MYTFQNNFTHLVGSSKVTTVSDPCSVPHHHNPVSQVPCAGMINTSRSPLPPQP